LRGRKERIMKLRKTIVLLLCFSLVFLATGLVCAAPANPDNDNNTEGNVITESDAGGGDLSQRDLLWIILGLLVLILIIVAIS
jgi:hypothetical protein